MEYNYIFKNTEKKTVFFEDIRALHYLYVKFYLFFGYKIFVFYFNHNHKTKKWLRDLINNGKVQKIYFRPNTQEHGRAIDTTEIIYDRLANKTLPKIISALYKTEATNCIFKQLLVEEIYKCIFINQYLYYIEKYSDEGQALRFIPENYAVYEKIIKDDVRDSIHLLRKVKIPVFGKFLAWVIQICEKWKYAGAVFLYVLVKSSFFILGKLGGRKKKELHHFEYAVSINGEHQVTFAGERGFDFLLDHKKINKENTVFILNVPIQEKFLKSYRDKGYVFFNANTIDGFLNLHKIRYKCAFILEAIKAVFNLKYFGNSSIAFFKAYFISLNVFMKWNLILQNVSFNNYIYMNEENARQSAINMLINQYEGKSWNCAFSLGGGYLWSNGKDFEQCRMILWAFLYCDYFLLMNRDAIDYQKMHRQRVKKYYDIGSIYSEMIQKSMESIQREEFLAQNFKQKATDETKIVSFFDTTFLDFKESATTFQDGIHFYEDIIKLLESKKDIFAVVKPTKNIWRFIYPGYQGATPERGEKISQLWNILQFHPRVFWASDFSRKKTGLDFRYNNDVMAVSDLVVTHCFSSPSAEALGARKKAIWYAPCNSTQGMYDKIPGLVAHGYKELQERVESLLYKTTTEQYDEYLNKYICEKVESRLDGFALTRFRELLTSCETNNVR